MKHLLTLLSFIILLQTWSVVTVSAAEIDGVAKNRQTNNKKMDCYADPAWCKTDDTTCRQEMRGRCGKRKGDWYGARQPVADASEAFVLIQNYFSGLGYSIAPIVERRWGFRAEILDKDGKVVDRVMIDKRTGRIRSIY